MLKSTIVDTRVRLRPSKYFVDEINALQKHFPAIPANLANVLRENDCLSNSIKILKDSEIVYKRPTINTELLEKLTADVPETSLQDQDQAADQPIEEEDSDPKPIEGSFLYANDLHWLNETLLDLRSKKSTKVFLHELLATCELVLPENELKPRNPELEARCQRLREQQQNREYHKMTKNVDAALKHYPEDTVAYQLKSINRQIIAVAQFIFSVAAGFTFGFFGVNLMVGGLPFGFRILLGVIVALIIALAEMYFLAKKLHEYDEVLDAPKRQKPESPKTSGVQKVKPHME